MTGPSRERETGGPSGRGVRLTVLGHPLHASLVHFPLGLLASVAVWDTAALVLEDPSWWALSFWALALGTAATLPALATGFLDFLELADDSPAEAVARRHMYAALAVVACYGTSLILRGGPHPLDDGSGLAAVGLSYLGLGLLALVGWLGGELVFRHGVGTESDGPR